MTTKIEWCDYTINPVKGICPVGCSYCYARRMYKRFGWNPEIRFDWSVANDLPKMRKGSRVFWGSTIELFGEWVEPEWMRLIMEAVKRESHLTHIFLTKQPQNLMRWSPFPPNVWVGVSAENEMMAAKGSAWLGKITAKVRFLSIEPLLSWDSENAFNSILRWHPENINWLIIGQQTPPAKKTEPKMEWLCGIVQAADKTNVPIFLKNNLIPVLEQACCPKAEALFIGENGSLRQEFPSE